LELTEYIGILRRYWKSIAACAVLGLLLAGVLAVSTPPTYTSQTKLFAATQSSGSIAELQQGNTFTQARVESYAETVDTPLVLQPVIDSLGLDTSPAELATRVEASADFKTVLLTITAEDTSPVQAAAIAQSVAESVVVAIETLETTSSDADSPVKLSVVTPASAPASPSSPNLRSYLFGGLAAGLVLGLVTALLRRTLDTKIKGETELKRITDAPILGGISFDGDATKKPLLTQAAPQSPRAESFRQIRTNLQFSQLGHRKKALLLTSSLPGEGKSTTAVNLAIALSQGGQSVVLIDADLRRPRVSEYLGLEPNAGLTTALIGRAQIEDLLQPWGEDELYVLTSGQIPPNPSELLGSDRMADLIAALEEKFDAVIIDAPPLLPVTDAAVLAQRVGGVVMVVGSSKVKAPEVQKSLATLDMVNADLLGVVINLLPTRGPDAYAYSYYSSEPDTRQKRSGSRTTARRTTASSDSDFDEVVLKPIQNQAREARR
jgi:capsular exopolysaccharide synthesis family protein